MGRTRSAEQTARLLLSNAFRYNTYECLAASPDFTRGRQKPSDASGNEKDAKSKSKSKQKSVEDPKGGNGTAAGTIVPDESSPNQQQQDLALSSVQDVNLYRVQLRDVLRREEADRVESPPLLALADAVHINVFDRRRMEFVGATHVLHPPRIEDVAFWFHSIPEDTLLVIEIVTRGTQTEGATSSTSSAQPVNTNSTAERLTDAKVFCWGFMPLSELATRRDIPMRPGTAHLLYLDESQWPRDARIEFDGDRDAADKNQKKKKGSKSSRTNDESDSNKKIGTAEAQKRWSLGYDSRVATGTALCKLLMQLVPRGVCVGDSFVQMDATTPEQVQQLPVLKPFRCIVRGVVIVPTTSEALAGFRDRNCTWSLVAVAHNGYQQLGGTGAEVPLGFFHSSAAAESALSKVAPKRSNTGAVGPCLISLSSLELTALPLHATTSIVLAIRCSRTITNNNNNTVAESAAVIGKDGKPASVAPLPAAAQEQQQYVEVVGFCVFPLCVMPMKDRDVHISDLPALRGPFECRDPRLRMTDSVHPYATVPLTLTMTVEYYDTPVPAAEGIDQVPATEGSVASDIDESDAERRRRRRSSGAREDELSSVSSGIVSPPTSEVSDRRRKDEKADSTAAGAAAATPTPSPTLPIKESDTLTVPQQAGSATVAPLPVDTSASSAQLAPVSPATGPAMTSTTTDINIYKVLCSIMEELRKVSEQQGKLMRRSNAAKDEEANLAGQSAQERARRIQESAERLADGVDGEGAGLRLVDLVPPRQTAITWELRCRLYADLQPILHPRTGRPLVSNYDDAEGGELSVPAAVGQTASIFGIRFEGITVGDEALAIPEQIAIVMSFGSLPVQRVGPLQRVRVGETDECTTYQLRDATGNTPHSSTGGRGGGFIWCEPLETVQDAVMTHYKSRGTMYVHLYDAVSMFYIATCNVPLSSFRRPFDAESATLPTDFSLHKDFSYTECALPATVFPVAKNIGQIHVTLFAVATAPSADSSEGIKGGAAFPSPVVGGTTYADGRRVTHMPLNPSSSGHVVVAKRITGADHHVLQGATGSGRSDTASTGHNDGEGDEHNTGSSRPLQWQRADYVKRLIRSAAAEGTTLSGTSMATTLPGVPAEHQRQLAMSQQQDAELEFKLRYMEKKREELKSQRIAEALLERLTVHHTLSVSWGRPEVIKTPFQNPFPMAMSFTVSIDGGSQRSLRVAGGRQTFTIGPKEWWDIPFIVTYCEEERRKDAAPNEENAERTARSSNMRCLLAATVFNESQEPVQYVKMEVAVRPVIVDRRYDLIGAAGTTVSKKLFSRAFSSSALPADLNESALLTRMRSLCAYCTTSEKATKATTRAVVDPITQAYLTAWEEMEISSRIPSRENAHRKVYVTLFYDEDMARVYELWEVRVSPCQVTIAHDIFFGQTSLVPVGVAASSGAPGPVEDIFCSDRTLNVSRRTSKSSGSDGGGFYLHAKPSAVGSQSVLLHARVRSGAAGGDAQLKKILLQIPCVFPTPTFSQVLELSARETASGPVFRRLRFSNQSDHDQIFRVHHNYKYNLFVNPVNFALSAEDVQYISLRLDMLLLPPGQLEGRWPIWIFINNTDDKTVESYLLQVVVRAHGVTTVGPSAAGVVSGRDVHESATAPEIPSPNAPRPTTAPTPISQPS